MSPSPTTVKGTESVMDTRTGEIMDMQEAERRIKLNPKDAKFLKELPDKFVEQLEGMNRADRRAWAKKNKHLLK